MKRIIAVMLAVVLVISGVSSFAYANEEPVNEVQARFETRWEYWLAGDTFTNGEVTGYKQWHAEMWNELPVTALALTVDSELEFDCFEGEYPVAMGPPTYKWSFGDVAEGDFVRVGVSLMGDWIDYPFPVTFTPGFDASRSADKTEFSQSDGTQTQTQTLTITVTPRQEGMKDLHMKVWADEDDLVNAVIISPTTDEEQGIELDPDGRYLCIELREPERDTTYTFIVTIEIIPKVPQVAFMPGFGVDWRGEHPASGTTSGSSVTYPVGDPVDEAGTWTWSAEGSYEWHWGEVLVREMGFEGYSRVNRVEAHFDTGLNYGPWPDTFTNGDEISLVWKDWDAKMGNSPDASGANVTGLTLSLDSELPFNTVSNGNLVTEEPPIYEWFFGDIPQGSGEEQAKAWVGLVGKEYSPPITFTPGFDASRSVDKAEFLKSEGTQTQTLTITLTPRQRTELDIGLGADENDLISPLIISAISGDGVEYPTDGHRVNICPITGLEPNTTWTLTVTFLVTPKVPKVKFIPYVEVGWNETIASGTTSGSSVSHPAGDDPADEPGTWTWSAEGNYEWHWVQVLHPRVHWFTRCREIVEPTPQELKGLAIEELETLTPTVSEQIRKEVEKAIGCLNKSLAPVLWVDEYHLVLDKGKEVFNHAKDAVKHLTAARKTALKVGNVVAADELLQVIDRIVEADRLLAETAVSEATDPDAVAKAQKLVEEAEAACDAGKYEDAVDRYRAAWEAATHAGK